MATETIVENTVPITLHLPQSLYERLTKKAIAEQRTPEEVLNCLAIAGIEKAISSRERWETLSASYCARLEREGRLDDPPEKVLQELRDQREQIANEFYPD